LVAAGPQATVLFCAWLRSLHLLGLQKEALIIDEATMKKQHYRRSDCPISFSLGPQQVIVATAHKIARVVYYILTTGESYREESAAEYEQQRREREMKHLQRRAQKLGVALMAVPASVSEQQPALFATELRVRLICHDACPTHAECH
jgi:hypothetical protein